MFFFKSVTGIAFWATLALATPSRGPFSPTPRLQARQNSTAPPDEISICSITKPSWADGNIDTAVSPPKAVTIVIWNKTTPERGSLDKGLFDNLKGECGRLYDDPHHPDSADVIQANPQTGALQAYAMYVTLPNSADATCIQRAITDAEDQHVTCFSSDDL